MLKSYKSGLQFDRDGGEMSASCFYNNTDPSTNLFEFASKSVFQADVDDGTNYFPQSACMVESLEAGMTPMNATFTC